MIQFCFLIQFAENIPYPDYLNYIKLCFNFLDIDFIDNALHKVILIKIISDALNCCPSLITDD